MTPKAIQQETQVQALTKSLKETFRLYAATHVAHWNVRGPYFPQLHALFEAQYTELWNALDVIAERIRHYGESVDPATLALDTPVPVADNEAKSVVRELALEHRALADRLREIERDATAAGDPGTADLAIQRVRAHDQHAWMLEAILE